MYFQIIQTAFSKHIELECGDNTFTVVCDVIAKIPTQIAAKCRKYCNTFEAGWYQNCLNLILLILPYMSVYLYRHLYSESDVSDIATAVALFCCGTYLPRYSGVDMAKTANVSFVKEKRKQAVFCTVCQVFNINQKFCIKFMKWSSLAFYSSLICTQRPLLYPTLICKLMFITFHLYTQFVCFI